MKSALHVEEGGTWILDTCSLDDYYGLFIQREVNFDLRVLFLMVDSAALSKHTTNTNLCCTQDAILMQAEVRLSELQAVIREQ